MAFVFLGLGAALGSAFVWLASRRPASEAGLLALGLIVAAVIYLGFALVAGAPADLILIEVIGVLVYGFLAWSGSNRHLGYLAAGWLLHVFWDAVLHMGATAGAYIAPDWYPWLCISFDLVVGVYVARKAGWLDRFR